MSASETSAHSSFYPPIRSRPIVCFQRENMKLAGTEQAWLVSRIIKNGPRHWCLRVWHFRATWSRACHTDNVPRGEVASETSRFIYLFLINPTQSRWQLRMEIVTFAVSLFASLLLSQCYTLYQKCRGFSSEAFIFYMLALNFWSNASGVLCSLRGAMCSSGSGVIEEKQDCRPVRGGPRSHGSCYVSTATSKCSLVYGCGACSFKIPMRLHPALSLSGRMI